MTNNLIDSDFTSIQQRISEFASSKQVKTIQNQCNKKIRDKIKTQNKIKKDLNLHQLPEAPLMPFCGRSHTDIHSALPFTKTDYFELVDSTGRVLRDDKRGAISERSLRLLNQLGIDPGKWIDHVSHFGRHYARCAGSSENIEKYSDRFNARWGKGVGFSRQVYSRCA